MLAKSELNSIEVFISKTFIDSVISHDEFVLISYMLEEYNKRRNQKFKNLISFLKILVYS